MVNLWAWESVTSVIAGRWLAGEWGVKAPGRVPHVTNYLMQLESIWEKWHTCRHQEITQFSTNYTIQQLFPKPELAGGCQAGGVVVTNLAGKPAV